MGDNGVDRGDGPAPLVKKERFKMARKFKNCFGRRKVLKGAGGLASAARAERVSLVGQTT